MLLPRANFLASGLLCLYPLFFISRTSFWCLAYKALNLPFHLKVSGCLAYPFLFSLSITHKACSSLCSPSRWLRHNLSGAISQILIAYSLNTDSCLCRVFGNNAGGNPGLAKIFRRALTIRSISLWFFLIRWGWKQISPHCSQGPVLSR